LLTESEVQQSYRQLVYRNDIDKTAIDRAENLLDELRPESPLRMRLWNELQELRKLKIDSSMS
tara:strand:+ start:5138 stop:5326 length:189 start_codon:yes stop_codon:yes gene_type:complete